MSAPLARLAAIALLLFSCAVVRAADAVVDAVRMPAWLERGAHVEPLLPGQQVRDGDRVRTGSGARAYLRLPEGSTVKLGESALLTYQAKPQALRADAVFRAALEVATGAFRFTTAAVQKLRKRDVAIHVGTATIGIRGTDVWGRSGKDEDLVILIEGNVELQPARGGAMTLADPLSVFTAPKGGAANPLRQASQEELAARARETEIERGDGALRNGGRVKLSLGDFGEQGQALALYDRARAAGFGARITPIPSATEGGGYRYEVALHGFASRAEARAAAVSLRQLAGIGPEGTTSAR